MMRNAHHERKKSGEKVTHVSTMSPETPTMQSHVKRSSNMTGVNGPDGTNSGRLTLHSVNNNPAESKKYIGEVDINQIPIDSDSPDRKYE